MALLLPLSVYWAIGPALAPPGSLPYAEPGVYPSDVAVAGLIAVTLVRRRLPGGALRHVRIGGLLGALVALGFITVPVALSPPVAAYTALQWLLGLGLYLVLSQKRGATDTWVSVFVVGLLFQTGVGMVQVIKQGPLGLPGEFALPVDQWGAAVLSVGGRPWLRPYGLTFHPNVLGGYLAMGLLLLLPLLDRRWARFVWWLLGVALLLSFSRSAWLAVAVVLPLLASWMAWHRRELRRPLAVTIGGAALVAIVILSLASGQLVSRLRPRATVTESRSLAERGHLIAVALDIVVERPLTGVGAGNFPLAADRSGALVNAQPVHNVVLLLASEVGVLGGVVWFLLWLAPGLALGDQLRSVSVWPVVLATAWFAWGIIGLWDHYPWALHSGRLMGISLLGLMSREWGSPNALAETP